MATALRVARATALRYVGQSDADDVASEAAMAALYTFDPSKGQWEPWVATVARTRSLDHLRRRRRRREQVGLAVDPVAPERDPDTSVRAWYLLVEHYVNGVALWSLARQANTTTGCIRRRLKAAVAEFVRTMEDDR